MNLEGTCRHLDRYIQHNVIRQATSIITWIDEWQSHGTDGFDYPQSLVWRIEALSASLRYTAEVFTFIGRLVASGSPLTLTALLDGVRSTTRGIELSVEAPGLVDIVFSSAQAITLGIALHNLVENAVHAATLWRREDPRAAAGPAVTIGVSVSGRRVEISITNPGALPGNPVPARPEGGLALARDCIAELGGAIVGPRAEGDDIEARVGCHLHFEALPERKPG